MVLRIATTGCQSLTELTTRIICVKIQMEKLRVVGFIGQAHGIALSNVYLVPDTLLDDQTDHSLLPTSTLTSKQSKIRQHSN